MWPLRLWFRQNGHNVRSKVDNSGFVELDNLSRTKCRKHRAWRRGRVSVCRSMSCGLSASAPSPFPCKLNIPGIPIDGLWNWWIGNWIEFDEKCILHNINPKLPSSSFSSISNIPSIPKQPKAPGMPLVIYDGQTTSFVAKIRSWDQLNRNQFLNSERLTFWKTFGCRQRNLIGAFQYLVCHENRQNSCYMYKSTQIGEGIGWIPGPGQWSYFRHL